MRRQRRIDPQAPPPPSPVLRRLAGWALKAAALVVVITAVGIAFDHPWWLTALILVGGLVATLALWIAGETVAPTPQTGAFTARDLLELAWDTRHTRPPGGNLAEPMPGHEGRRFTGR